MSDMTFAQNNSSEKMVEFEKSVLNKLDAFLESDTIK
jgi:hypothetical protein